MEKQPLIEKNRKKKMTAKDKKIFKARKMLREKQGYAFNRMDKEGNIFYFDENFCYHNDNGPGIIWKDGDKDYYRHDMWHREDGPAVDHKDEKIWYKNNVCTRLDGPAIIKGDKEVYMINDVEMSKQEFFEKKIMAQNDSEENFMEEDNRMRVGA
jgi:hypothetical protein